MRLESSADGPGTYIVKDYTFTLPSGEQKSGQKVIYYKLNGEEYTVEEFYGPDQVIPGFTPQ